MKYNKIILLFCIVLIIVSSCNNVETISVIRNNLVQDVDHDSNITLEVIGNNNAVILKEGVNVSRVKIIGSNNEIKYY